MHYISCVMTKSSHILNDCHGVFQLTGVVIGIAQKRFGPRRVGVVATVMAVTGLLIPYFEDNIYVLYVTFGAMFGKYTSKIVIHYHFLLIIKR